MSAVNTPKASLRRRLDKALQLRSEARDGEAESELLSLLQDFGRHPGVMQVLAETYFLMDRHADALPYALDAVKLRPTAVHASLTLFHCLYALGKEEDAYREMLRFMSLRQSNEYDELAAGLAGSQTFEKIKREVAEEAGSDPEGSK